MATQGILSITKKGKMHIKVVAGSNGGEIPQFAEWLKENSTASTEAIWTKAKALFGTDSLVMQTSAESALYEGDFEPPTLDEDSLYFQTFNDPEFNPRWAEGIAEYTEIIDIT